MSHEDPLSITDSITDPITDPTGLIIKMAEPDGGVETVDQSTDANDEEEEVVLTTVHENANADEKVIREVEGLTVESTEIVTDDDNDKDADNDEDKDDIRYEKCLEKCRFHRTGHDIAVSTIGIEMYNALSMGQRRNVPVRCQRTIPTTTYCHGTRDALQGSALAQWSLDNPQEELLVLGTVVESQHLRRKNPMWERSGLMLVGFKQNGSQIRLAWFKHARVKY
ncbi:hypothetical protein FRACYDRAFT_235698 [Fragilariopsis cylindrus CCMP1102]|uniref:Uncharacterized protein n=1 Tax=Fragilariopsis cylindrus CCMP1102 TaxID=635003 RepID=A0A1E7FNA2_9STRA|nr:hypothetical protein FRACYDRAFT_235698 [Fragilariopsis cylindrus CCMP1102]|eukprot:OEU19640.1 hypothetical protein FRACYDRAFT_235698 [Fragilariopsis cylindrus CCMP1102]